MSEANESGLLDLELHAEVWLGRERIPLERLLELRTGSVLPLTHDPDGPVDLVVNGTRVAQGQLVVVDGRFGFRVSSSDDTPLADVEAASAETAPNTDAESAELPPLAEPDGIDKPAQDAPVEDQEASDGD